MTNCFGKTEFEYDSFGNLKKVNLPSGKIVEYKTDGMNRRVKKLINGQTSEYYLWYDDHRLAAVLDSSKTPKLTFVYGPESNHSPSYVIKNNKTYKVIHDPGTGSVRYIVDPENAYVVQELEYDEYGNMMRNTSPDWQPLTFAGGLRDSDTKLVRFGERDYDPTIGRWTTKDPIGFLGGDTNLYAYVGGNPMSYIDPMGLSQEQINKALDWIKINRPELLNGLNVTVKDSILGKALSFGQGEGFTSGNTIFIDTGSIFTSPMSDADVTGMVAHELQHSRRGFLNTLFYQTDQEHNAIYDLQNEVTLEYQGGARYCQWVRKRK